MEEDDWISPEEARQIAAQKAAELEELRQATAAARGARTGQESSWTGGGKSGGWMQPSAQLSSAVSDFVLFLASVLCVWMLWGSGDGGFVAEQSKYTRHLAAMGYALLALAAGAGSLRFLSVLPIVFHEKLASIASLLSLALIACACVFAGESPLDGFRFHQVTPAVLSIAAFFVIRDKLKFLEPFVSPVAAVVMLLKGFALILFRGFSLASLGLIAGVGICLAASVYLKPIRRNKSILGPWIRGIDAFHYLFAIGIVLLALSLNSIVALRPMQLMLFKVYY